MNDQGLRDRLAAIEARLSMIERRLSGVAWEQEPPVQPSGARPAPTAAPMPRSAPAPHPAPARIPEPASAHRDGLERFLGVKVAAWVGGIIVIAAIAVFARFVIE